MRYLLALVSVLIATTPSLAADLDVTGMPVVQLQGYIQADSMEAAKFAVIAAAARSPSVVLVINSPGGEVYSGLVLINAMHQLQQSGTTFICLVPGMAMSMGFMILAECDERYTWDDSLLLFHPIKVSGIGSLSGEAARTEARSIYYLEHSLKERLLDTLDAPRAWFEYHYGHETVHRGTQLAQKLPDFIQLVTSYKGITAAQLNPAPPPQPQPRVKVGGSYFQRLNR